MSESHFLSFLVDEMDTPFCSDLSVRDGRNANYIKRILLLAEYQFGEQIPGECYRRLKNGATFRENWIMFTLREILTETYINQNTHAACDIALGYATETLAQLELRRNNADDRKRSFYYLYRVHTQLGNIFKRSMRYEEGLHHMQEALAAARHVDYRNDEGPLVLIEALKNMAGGCALMNREAAKYAEEAYILASGHYGPEDPRVQDSATYLIDSCLQAKNYIDAERFARITYECMIDPNNCGGKLVTDGKIQLARVWLHTPSDQRTGGPEAAEEAETMIREACEAIEGTVRVEGLEDHIAAYVSTSNGLLAEVMMARGKMDREVEKTLLKALSFTKDCRVGVVPRNSSSLHRYEVLRLLARLYLHLAADLTSNRVNLKPLLKARIAYQELVKIATALFRPDDNRLIECIEKASDIEESLNILYPRSDSPSPREEGG